MAIHIVFRATENSIKKGKDRIMPFMQSGHSLSKQVICLKQSTQSVKFDDLVWGVLLIVSDSANCIFLTTV